MTKRIKRVVRRLDHGSIRLNGAAVDTHYLVFELADRDLREHDSLEKTLDGVLNLRILHQVASALESLHYNQISHQDIKPSNVLIFDESIAKLGDLGHAHDRQVSRPGLEQVLAGDPVHAPPEQLYGLELTEWASRRLASDLYLLGSLVVFMFTGLSLSTQIGDQLKPEHHWQAWTGDYKDAQIYVYDAWDAAIEEFSGTLDISIRENLETFVRYLTDPDPAVRGHPRNRLGHEPTYGVRRFSSGFELLAKRLELNMPRGEA